ncbi:MAG: 4-hydroxy-3-methylbut-2-enyl diphosphate reductase [Zetaproteobacteria bacterium CG12_big_fil_rev_8_21_14_0_65_54_13]|nr:MAG: 4-hydroxy-3-methylbut-2-enyl diphosphate reductase [Zetaproteobacteria bacterium CG12_big_fil_rev_8_21_14_0_65_54_13]PIX55614.1 MAG: 4-hydroxy-3-methylbut-2-enyl diphosphate reductase [Zetaproteobacteria bacterium CG_4_10_14_3_um_filter_54_28]PJA27740.1 MAG: 4-hydroxy-3-methylbut-2-enyl diphosphate reductase [Zetaproteobacteria bacterium CG_4_9_14_3_um_filter_54_145]
MQQESVPVTFHSKSLLLAEPRGFCAGVDRAIEIVERSLAVFGAPVYVRHEIVHNRYVVQDLQAKGAVFIEEVDDAPDDALLIFSAHGVSKAVRERADARGLRVIDATCPLVTKVHLELLRHYQRGDQVILIGHAGHPEVEGTMGQAPAGAVLLVATPEDVANLQVKDPERLAYVTQTTLSVDDTADVISALRSRFPNLQGPKREDICYATSNRQAATKELAGASDVVLVIGSKNSSNSNRLREVAERSGCDAYLIDGPDDIDPAWLAPDARIGITAGASAPEVLVESVITWLQARDYGKVELLSVGQESVTFGLPEALRQELPD